MKLEDVAVGAVYLCVRLKLRGTVTAIDGDALTFRYWKDGGFVDVAVRAEELAGAGESKPMFDAG